MDVPDLEDVWEACRRLPTLGSLAAIEKGLEHRSDLPEGVKAFSQHYFPGAVPGFVRLNPHLEIHDLPEELWVNVDPAMIRRPGAGTTTGAPQLLLNHTRVSRGPWRLKAVIDTQGHAITGRFLAARPRTKEITLSYLWALSNSPLANGFVFAHSMTRHVLKKTVTAVPVPQASSVEMARVVEAVHAYFAAVRSGPGREGRAKEILLGIDAEVLRLYGLPPRLERKLLDLFQDHRRPGVPFELEGYFPPDFEPALPLHFFLSDEYRRSTAGALRSRHRVASSPEILNALQKAREDFSE